MSNADMRLAENKHLKGFSDCAKWEFWKGFNNVTWLFFFCTFVSHFKIRLKKTPKTFHQMFLHHMPTLNKVKASQPWRLSFSKFKSRDHKIMRFTGAAEIDLLFLLWRDIYSLKSAMGKECTLFKFSQYLHQMTRMILSAFPA